MYILVYVDGLLYAICETKREAIGVFRRQMHECQSEINVYDSNANLVMHWNNVERRGHTAKGWDFIGRPSNLERK